jgi:hypothetical protein
MSQRFHTHQQELKAVFSKAAIPSKIEISFMSVNNRRRRSCSLAGGLNFVWARLQA